MTPAAGADDLALALELADLADAVTLGRFRSPGLRVERKPDLTPVSDVDRSVETLLRHRLAQARPGDAVLGEEQGEDPGAGAARRWLLDPVDGTRNYVRGVAVFATLVALEVEGEVEVGVVSAPALGRRWWAARGRGAHAEGGRRLRVSRVRAISDAYISTTSPWHHFDDALRHAYDALAARCWTARGFGDFHSHMLVAEGAIDIAVEVGAALWDWAAPLLIVEEAGGRFSDLRGQRRADGDAGISSNGLLHDDVLAALRG